ncbi:Cullin [Fimicolochytrium jonesii]|nr:Cullin [Fimicolochytrium jonesii]KAI8821887.1 Cullin [Fimicolochytrium jonesii]
MLVSLTSAKDVTRTGHEPTVYETDFEVQFLQTSNDFYSLESGMSLHECNATEYLKRAERRLIEEEQRIDNYLTPATEPKIRRVVEKQLLENHVKTIIEMENSGMVSMMEDDKLDDLRRMYKLLGRVPNGHIQMRQTLSQFMEDHVAEINQTVGGIDASQPSRMSKSASASSIPSAAAAAADTEKAGAQKADPLKWVEQVLALKEKVDAYFEHSFANDSNFETEMNNALERSLNRNRKAPEFVSLFIDENLKKGLKGKSEEEVDALLDRTVTIFRFVQEKDIFERYYKQHLAKRLLFGKSISEDVEKNMISKLKTECGYQFTQKWEGMFNDMRTSTDMMVDFHNHLATAVTAPKDMVNLNISILTSSYWPMTGIGADQVCHFPPEVAACQQHFDKYYHSRHSGRRLTWSSQLGTADIKASFKKGNKEFNVSTYGMLVLVGVFNDVADGEAVSYQTISDKSGIPEQDLKRTLQSLALGKHKILLKSTKGPAVNPTDTFKVNTEFTSPMYKFKIQQVAGSTKSSHGAAISGNSMETDAERTETMEKIEEARKHQIEACIVRIMKARKKLDHNNLVAEVIKQTTSRFVPEPAIVKRRIEGLIEREYLERDKSDRKMYNYLA